MEIWQAVEGNKSGGLKTELSQTGKSFASCLCFRMEPLLVKVQSCWSNTDDVERLPRSYCLLGGFYFHLKVLHLCRG